MKQCIALLVGILLVSVIGLSTALAFSDVPSSHGQYQAITFLEKKKIVEGYRDNTYRPNQSLTRAELVAILVRATTSTTPSSTTYRNCFSDVRTEWFAPYVCYAAKQGWVDGSQNRFRPADTVTRGEGAKLTLEALQIPLVDGKYLDCADTACRAWYGKYAHTIKARNLLNFTLFEGEKALTRGAMAELVFRSYIVKDFKVAKYHPTQGDLYARTNGNITFTGGTSYQWSTPDTSFAFNTNPVRTNFQNSTEERTLQNAKAPHLRIGNTTYYVAYEETTPGNKEAVMIRFDNGKRTWYRNNYETSRHVQSHGYGIFAIQGNIYVAFAVNNDSGSISNDFMQFTQQGWLTSYGALAREENLVTVLVRINPETGQGIEGTYISGLYSDGRTAATYITDVQAHPNGGLLITGETLGVPRTPNKTAATEVAGTPAPRSFVLDMTQNLRTARAVETGGYRYIQQ